MSTTRSSRGKTKAEGGSKTATPEPVHNFFNKSSIVPKPKKKEDHPPNKRRRPNPLSDAVANSYSHPGDSKLSRAKSASLNNVDMEDYDDGDMMDPNETSSSSDEEEEHTGDHLNEDANNPAEDDDDDREIIPATQTVENTMLPQPTQPLFPEPEYEKQKSNNQVISTGEDDNDDVDVQEGYQVLEDHGVSDELQISINGWRPSDSGNQVVQQLTISKLQLLHILKCEWEQVDNDNCNIIQLLRDLNPFLAKAKTAVLLLDYICWCGDVSKLANLHRASRVDQSCNLMQLAQLAVIYVLQRRLRMEQIQTQTWEDLDDDIRLLISLDFYGKIHPPNDASMSPVLTLQEHQLLLKIYDVFVDMIYHDSSEGSSDSKMQKSNMQLVSEYLQCITEGRRPNLLDTLFMINQSLGLGADLLTIDIPTSTGALQLRVHKSKLERLGWNDKHDNRNAVDATGEDVKAFINLLYANQVDDKLLQTNVQSGVAEIAEWLGFNNVWYFMLRDKYTSNLITKKNKVSFLKVLCKCKRMMEIEQVVQQMTYIFPGNEWLQCMNGLSSEQVCLFMQHGSTARVDVMSMYKILVNWAYSAEGISCEDPMKTRYNKGVDQQFRKVKHLLPQSQLCNEFGKFKALGYLKEDDWRKAYIATYFPTSMNDSVNESVGANQDQ